MRTELRTAYPDWKRRYRGVKIMLQTGKPYEIDDLNRVSVHCARHIVVLGGSRRPRVADSHMLTTVCALRCLPDGRDLKPNTLVVAEVSRPHVQWSALPTQRTRNSVQETC